MLSKSKIKCYKLSVPRAYLNIFLRSTPGFINTKTLAPVLVPTTMAYIAMNVRQSCYCYVGFVV